MAGRTGVLVLRCVCLWVAAVAAARSTREKRTAGSEEQLQQSSSWQLSAPTVQHCQTPGKQGTGVHGKGC